jgi:hypothetical protein
LLFFKVPDFPLLAKRNQLNPDSGGGNEIERTCRAPTAVGRVTPCAPRLPPAGANFPRRRLPNPLPIKTFLPFPIPTSDSGLNKGKSLASAIGNRTPAIPPIPIVSR